MCGSLLALGDAVIIGREESLASRRSARALAFVRWLGRSAGWSSAVLAAGCAVSVRSQASCDVSYFDAADVAPPPIDVLLDGCASLSPACAQPWRSGDPCAQVGESCGYYSSVSGQCNLCRCEAPRADAESCQPSWNCLGGIPGPASPPELGTLA